jgi:hypothetical protein
MSDQNFQTNFGNENSNSQNNINFSSSQEINPSSLPQIFAGFLGPGSESLQSSIINDQEPDTVLTQFVDTSNIGTNSDTDQHEHFIDPDLPSLTAVTSYTRLSRTIGSFLNRTSSASSVDEVVQEESSMNIEAPYTNSSNSFATSTSSSTYSLFNSEAKKARVSCFRGIHDPASKTKFHPKTSKFNSLNSMLTNLKKTKRNANSNPVMLERFALLMSNCENYYKVMNMPMEDIFNTRASTKDIKASLEKINSSKKLKHSELQTDENSLELLDLTSQIENELNEFKASSNSISINREFHLCSLCSHCLVEPVTLVCGCSFCKKCLKELNNDIVSSPKLKGSNQHHQSASLFDSSDSESNEEFARGSLLLKRKYPMLNNHASKQVECFRCFSCGKEHDHNSLNFLKQNVLLTDTVDKFWSKNVEVRKLRNDIRNYVSFCLEDSMQEFDVTKFEYMLKDAYNQDPSNHLLLADLFLLNYFNDFNEDCIRYAKMACEIRPDWAFVRNFNFYT